MTPRFLVARSSRFWSTASRISREPAHDGNVEHGEPVRAHRGTLGHQDTIIENLKGFVRLVLSR
jgi:hypothetical protein